MSVRKAARTSNNTTQAAHKVIRLLNCFTSSAAASLGVTELSAMTGWTSSSVSRLLSALEAGGLVQRDDVSGRYLLGLQLVALAGAALAQRTLYTVSHPHLLQLAAASGETTNLCVLDSMQVLTIDEALGTQPIKVSGWMGVRHPLHATAAGKVLLAVLPEERRDVILATGLPALTPQTIINRERLLREVEQVNAIGYALTVEELAIGLTVLAAPLRDFTGAVVAAITIGGPSFRITGRHLEDCITLIKAEAAAIAGELGSRLPALTPM